MKPTSQPLHIGNGPLPEIVLRSREAWSVPARHDRKGHDCRKRPSSWERLVGRPDLDFEEVRKRRLFTILLIPGILILFSFGPYHLANGDTAEGLFDLLVGGWLIFTLAAFRVFRNGRPLYRFNAVLLGALFLYLAMGGGLHGNKIMWVFSFPLIALYTLGKKEGLVSTAVLLGLILAVFYGPVERLGVYAYPPPVKIRFLGSFFLVACLTYIYESVREHSQAGLEDERNKLAAETAKLADLSSALQKANRSLRVSEERLTRAQAIARVGNLEYDIASRMMWGSREALRILGIEDLGVEFPPSVLERLIPDFESFWIDLQACIRERRDYDRELTVDRLSDGRPVVVRVKAELVRGGTGRAETIIGVIQDISDAKAAEREKRELEEKLARSQKMESLGLLAGGVAHDLNNVLTGVVSYPDLLLSDLPPDSPLVEPLKVIQESGKKAAAIVQDLLTLARRGVTHYKVLNLNDLVTEYLGSPEHRNLLARFGGVDFETCLDPTLLNVRGASMQLRKTLMNLAANAVEALPAGGCVRVLTENRYVDGSGKGAGDIPEGEYAVLRVEDNGIGISPTDLKRIFEPFYTKKQMGRSGTGLGMSVVWGTVQDHRGHIQVDSREGAGTRITLYFPVTREAVADADLVIPVDEYVGRGETLLVVDDLAEQRTLAKNMLTRLGYRVHTAANGEAAIAFLSGKTVDLVILDMIMEPGIDGLDTYVRILESHPGQRAIIVSGYAETDRVNQAQRLGATVYVKKPYTLEKLGVAVREALDQEPGPAEASAPLAPPAR